MMFRVAALLLLCAPSFAADKIYVPVSAPEDGVTKSFHDSHYGVRFQVPPGWGLNKKDHQVSTFRFDAPNATARNEVRAVVSMEFNPFPLSTLSGALVYYSDERHANDNQCRQEAALSAKAARPDVQNIGGLNFIHDHLESGVMCLESRDDVYVAYRKGSCYRFDLVVHMFCSEVSGAQDLTVEQAESVETRMAEVLSSTSFDWDKAPSAPVPAPIIHPDESFHPSSKHQTQPSATL